MNLGTEELIDHYKSQYLKRLRKSGFTEEQLSRDFHVPSVSIVKTKQTGKFMGITFRLNDTRYKLRSYNVYVNDVPLFGALGKSVMSPKATITEKIELNGGINKIEISTINERGVESYRAMTLATTSDNVENNLYFVGFGASKYKDKRLSLKYADKDVRDLSMLFSKMKAWPYKNVFIKTYLNEEVTPQSIFRAKEFLKNSKIDDTVVLFIAGHGLHDKDKDATYYYLTHNTELDNLSRTALSFDSIEDLLMNIRPRKKLLLMDTCESGEIEGEVQNVFFATADERGIRPRAIRGIEVTAKSETTASVGKALKRSYLLLRDRYIYNNLTRRSGAIVFSSSRGEEFSYESDSIQNGFFTKEIVNALTQKRRSNHILSTDELVSFVSKEVFEKTGGLQNPVVDRDNLYQKLEFPIVQ